MIRSAPLLLLAFICSFVALPTMAEPYQPADVAAPKLDPSGRPQSVFLKRQNAFISDAKIRQPQVIFLGDSITSYWRSRESNRKIFDREFAQYNASNYGIGGNRVQNVLWQVQNGLFNSLRPKVVVIMIGTNNANPMLNNPPEQVASGIRKIVDNIHQRSPGTKILLHAIFPRGSATLNARNSAVNDIIARLDDGRLTHFLDINSSFLTNQDKPLIAAMPDQLHLSGLGYQIWADAIQPSLRALTR